LSDDFWARAVSASDVVTEAVLERARAGDDRAFGELTDPYLGELRLHCYRMLGSVQDAEDVLQETLLSAWRGLGQYEGRASLRTWLYRIATNRCLNELRAGARRPRVEPAGPPFVPPEPTRRGEPVWLQPYPDALLDGLADLGAGPEARYEAKETIAWPSFLPSSTCRRGSGRCSCCGMCSAFVRRRSRTCWLPARPP
jgi:RNA polymerase sigma factor (sigma-70 family)